MYMNYKSISDLNTAIISNLHKFPHDVDFVVGIPRSGMMPANLLALYLNKPFTDIDSFLEGRIYSSGVRGSFIKKDDSFKVIVMDDSINSGNALEKVKEKISKKKDFIKDYEIKFGVVFATESSKSQVDYYCELVETPRVFQWNIFHQKNVIPFSCFDIDGVLCLNPPEDDDGPIYLDYIKNAPALYIPSVEIDTLVSCRLEKYRAVTEQWLSENGVKYKKLVMLDMPDKATRVTWGKHGEYKGNVYKNSKNVLFVESSLKEALDIFKVSHKPVFCTETMQMINDESFVGSVDTLFRKKKMLLKKIYRRIFPKK